MKELEYPFDNETILKKKKSIRKKMIDSIGETAITKKIAVLGGQTTHSIVEMMELFLLNYGIRPIYYESEYNQWYEDGAFENGELKEFQPDIIYICTCIRNINQFPLLSDSKETVDDLLESILGKFRNVWDFIADRYQCTIVQNNFEYPFFRLMGNKDASDYHGRVNFVTRLNGMFYDYAQSHDNFFICDVNYISANYGLEQWSNPYYWHMYKYAVAVPAIPCLSYNIANIIKSVYGKNKKVLNLDMDNTLWGGIVGDDGAENIEIGQETSLAQTYSEFQEYLKLHKQLGILLTINSKNDERNALSGLARPDSILAKEDFSDIRANWNPKHKNLHDTAEKLNILPDSFVFVDDNPAEREIVRDGVTGAAVPEIGEVESYIRILDRSGFFEVTTFSKEDQDRSRMYEENAKRIEEQTRFQDYGAYLRSLDMHGEFSEFTPLYMSRIAQLTNKSNQFNLTTKRFHQNDLETLTKDPDYITLYGKLTDKFGDNGVVSVVIGRISGKAKDELHMELWLMSCRVLKRDMEYAMMDELVEKCREKGIKSVYGYYYPTLKNGMVKDFYALQGFDKISEDGEGNTVWRFDIPVNYNYKNHYIGVNDNE